MADSAPQSEITLPNATTMRLQRALAAAGVASRRHCEQIIREGRVDVDGKTVLEMGTKVDPMRQKITVDGQPIRRPRLVYFMLNKPAGALSTSHDESGRLRAIDLVNSSERIYTVGRLDKSSEGLIVLTNDGDLANQLTHPRYGVEKTYHVRVVGLPSPEQLERLRAGIHLAEAYGRVAAVRVKKKYENSTDLEIVLKEGRNREIRRIMARLGHKVVMLKRIAIGPIRLGEMPRGAYRELTSSELSSLRGSVASIPKSDIARRKPRHGRSWKTTDKYPRRASDVSRSRQPNRGVGSGKAMKPRSRPRRGNIAGSTGTPPRRPGPKGAKRVFGRGRSNQRTKR